MESKRTDRAKGARGSFEKNKKRILSTQTVCAICGQPVDFSRSFPDPMSPTVDHIIPVSKGGHPFSMDNLQLAHFICNRLKSDKLSIRPATQEETEVNNRDLPLAMDWKNYKS